MTEPESDSDFDSDSDLTPDSDSETGPRSDSEFGDRRDGDDGVSLRVRIEPPSVEAAERLAAWWVALANEQRAYRSHLLGEPNRTLIRETMARHIVTEGMFVARLDAAGNNRSGASSDRDEPVRSDRTERDRATTDECRTTDRASRAGKSSGASAAATDLVGFVMFGPETGSYDQSIDRGVVENIYVHPDYRGRGIGGALLDAAEAALAESGVEAITLEAMADNEAARRLYARRGYYPHRVELEAAVSDLPNANRDDRDDRDDHDDRDDRDDRDDGSHPF